MAGDSSTGLVLPPITTYLSSVSLSAIPKLVVIILASIVAGLRADYFSSRFFLSAAEDLPVEICFYTEDDGNYRGDRICNNALANGVVSILVAMALLMIDLMIPCLTVKSFTRVAHITTVVWASLMAFYWCVTGSLLTNLYNRFTDDNQAVDDDELDRQQKFRIFPAFSYLLMIGWIGIGVLSLVRIFVKRSAVKCLPTSTDI